MNSILKNRKILIIGGTGSLGKALINNIASGNYGEVDLLSPLINFT